MNQNEEYPDDKYCELSFAYITSYILSERPEREAWLQKLQDLKP